MKSNIPKQFLQVKGKPLICYAMEVFQNSIVDEMILVTREQDMEYCRAHMCYPKVTEIVAGGQNRYDSVWNGLQAVNEKSEAVLIHDAARPFVTEEMIQKSVEAAMEFGACTVAVPVKDTIKVVNQDGFGVDTPDRSTLYQIQTPQSFRRELITEAYRRMYESGDRDITDDTTLVERYMKQPVKIIPGSYRNIKVTTNEDIEVVEVFATR
jgi:2-C-methyl-D-erythritol 4-phosphate cytidylyltransferase